MIVLGSAFAFYDTYMRMFFPVMITNVFQKQFLPSVLNMHENKDHTTLVIELNAIFTY